MSVVRRRRQARFRPPHSASQTYVCPVGKTLMDRRCEQYFYASVPSDSSVIQGKGFLELAVGEP